ncbi:MAG: ammonium transporter, partial [Deltaproteobacteria bacterium]|nr:ammonium transporter [Deltaproteobacteria bacterium]
MVMRQNKKTKFLMLMGLFLISPGIASAGTGIDSADTAWMMVSTGLVMLMIPGLALFYGGMVRSGNVLSVIMHSLFAMGVMSIQWYVIG